MDSKVKLLKKIIDATDAKIVLSSDWRLEEDTPDYKYLINKLRYNGRVKIYDKTPDLRWQRRGLEIESWLKNNPKVESWVVLDDTDFSDFNKIMDHVVLTDGYYGLQETDVEKAIEILKRGKK